MVTYKKIKSIYYHEMNENRELQIGLFPFDGKSVGLSIFVNGHLADGLVVDLNKLYDALPPRPERRVADRRKTMTGPDGEYGRRSGKDRRRTDVSAQF